jgi:very-short-patch-repair endonuclease
VRHGVTVTPDFTVRTRAQMLQAMSRRDLARAVRSGRIVRVRRDRYLDADSPQGVRDAVRIGGRLTCLSLLQLLGVFVWENARLHTHIMRGSSRLRSTDPDVGTLEPRAVRAQVLHWLPLARPERAGSSCVDILDALVHAVLCQAPRHAVASIDSALNKGLIDRRDLEDLFASLPRRFRALRPLVDGRAQSGPETLVRLMARSLGCRVDLQVAFDGIGFVDLVIDGWLVVECDSKEFHASWEQQAKDRKRDMALAALGYATMRLTAADIMYRPESVLVALRGLVATHRACVGR